MENMRGVPSTTLSKFISVPRILKVAFFVSVLVFGTMNLSAPLANMSLGRLTWMDRVVNGTTSTVAYSIRAGSEKVAETSILRNEASRDSEYEYETYVNTLGKSNVTCPEYHIIHVGKAGGTSIARWHRGINKRSSSSVYWHGRHGHTLGLISNMSACYIFSVRDPISRWVSGFWSNARLGCPDHFKMVIKDFRSEDDDKVEGRMQNLFYRALPFFAFPTPNDLAEALSHPTMGRLARTAISIIPHLRRNFEYYLPNLESMVASGRVPLVISVTSFDSDIKRLEHLAGLPSNGETEKSAPKSLSKSISELSPLAKCNLAQLLKRDYELMSYLYDVKLVNEQFVPPECTIAALPRLRKKIRHC